MSAVLQALPWEIVALQESDLELLLVIEGAAYEFPWTLGNFTDSMKAGYLCRALRVDSNLCGYSVMMPGVDEAHLLNLTIAPALQRRGWGGLLLEDVLASARSKAAARLFLEVRPTNQAGLALYKKRGFERVGLRKQYYPGLGNTREDALVLALNL